MQEIFFLMKQMNDYTHLVLDRPILLLASNTNRKSKKSKKFIYSVKEISFSPYNKQHTPADLKSRKTTMTICYFLDLQQHYVMV